MVDIRKLEGYTWKGEKKKFGGEVFQESIKLIDATEDKLNEFYKHCKVMLYNDSKQFPGRYPLLATIKEQIDRCGAELFVRSIEQKGLTRFSFMETIRSFLSENAQIYKDLKDEHERKKLGPVTIEFVCSGVTDEYKKLPLDLVMDCLFDRLGKFNKQHITLTFILKQGVWFTPTETQDLTEKDINGKIRNRLDVVKERLGLRQDTDIFISPKGLNYSQLRAMINLTSKKYSELTTAQLQTLRYRILFALEDHVQMHINQWTQRMKMIEEVCDYKGYVLEG